MEFPDSSLEVKEEEGEDYELPEGNLSRVLTTKPLEAREFQFVYTCSLLSNAHFIRKQNGPKLQSVFYIYALVFSKKYWNF